MGGVRQDPETGKRFPGAMLALTGGVFPMVELAWFEL